MVWLGIVLYSRVVNVKLSSEKGYKLNFWILLFFKPERKSTKKYCSNIDLVLIIVYFTEKIKVSVVKKNICES